MNREDIREVRDALGKNIRRAQQHRDWVHLEANSYIYFDQRWNSNSEVSLAQGAAKAFERILSAQESKETRADAYISSGCTCHLMRGETCDHCNEQYAEEES
ncbi:hypothetical protein [Denitrobaculum tricleocarpae]|uniref:Uncharacterized protein n=1 Tax=Denitrobaculum tricleocarpae TaxID=2591009 RepID=A0A545TT06_9PROT|nr:hypothetical protein [Denitrobaculum tricleocarpae]TQV80355.1 hypothetical protein FKG95_09170 [Denitrobaculum tricleocarpae]